MIVKPINQALSPGDIIGTAFNLLRHNIGFTCKILLLPTILNMLGSMAIQWAVTKPTEMMSSLAGMGTLFAVGLAGLVAGLIAKWILTLRQMALMRMAGGFSSDWTTAYMAVSERKWQVVALWFLMVILTVAIFIVWLVQCYSLINQSRAGADIAVLLIVGILGLLLALGILFFASFICLCLLACDNLTFKESVDKTIVLISQNFLRCFGFSAALILTICVLSYPLSMPIALLGVWDTYQLGTGHGKGEMPIYTMIIGHVWESFITLLISPLLSFAYAIFYVDLLNRKEGLDLKRRLSALIPAPGVIGEYGTERS